MPYTIIVMSVSLFVPFTSRRESFTHWKLTIAAKLRPMLDAFWPWAETGFCRATPDVSRDVGCCGGIRRTAPCCRLLTRIPSGIVISEHRELSPDRLDGAFLISIIPWMQCQIWIFFSHISIYFFYRSFLGFFFFSITLSLFSKTFQESKNFEKILYRKILIPNVLFWIDRFVLYKN
jgi:hypothetical protein